MADPMIEFACERCGKAFKVADTLAGKSAKCKSCGAVIRVPSPAEGSAPAIGITPGPAPTRSAPAPTPTPSVPPPMHVGPASPRPAPGRGTSGLGVAAVILGALALLLCWIPLVNVLALLLAVVGGVLGLVGGVAALTGKKSSPGWPVAGVVVNGLAVIGFVATNIVFAAAIRKTAAAYSDAVAAAREADRRARAAGAAPSDAGAAAGRARDPLGAKADARSPADVLASRPPLVPGESVFLDPQGSNEAVWLVVAEEDIPLFVKAQAKIDGAFVLTQDSYAGRRALSDADRIHSVDMAEAKVLGPVARTSSGWYQVEIDRGDRRGLQGWADGKYILPARLYEKRPAAEVPTASDAGKAVVMDAAGDQVGLRIQGMRGRNDRDSACFVVSGTRARLLEIVDGATCLVEVSEGDHAGKRGYVWKNCLRVAE